MSLADDHVPTVLEYDWTLGPRHRWSCSCGEGGGGYTSDESAMSGFKAHYRAKEMWERHEARVSGLEQGESR